MTDATDIVREFAAPPGWAGTADKGTQVAIDTTITEELKLEGLAREVIRQVQDTRRKADLDLLDKIALHLAPGSPALEKAITAHRDDIARSVQATQCSDAPLNGEAHTAAVQIDGQPLTIALREVNAGVLECTQIDPEAEAAARAEALTDPDFSLDPFGTDDLA